MSNFRPTERQTGFLMPPSVDEWLRPSHPARLVVVVVDGLNLKALSKVYRGTTHPVVQQRQRVGPTRQTVRHRTIAAVVTRYEQLPRNSHATVALAALLRWCC